MIVRPSAERTTDGHGQWRLATMLRAAVTILVATTGWACGIPDRLPPLHEQEGGDAESDAAPDQDHADARSDGLNETGPLDASNEDGGGVEADGPVSVDAGDGGPRCGDGIVQAPEECDDGNPSNSDACLNTCKKATCGDGYQWVGVEACDDGNTKTGDGCGSKCTQIVGLSVGVYHACVTISDGSVIGSTFSR